MEAKTTQNMQQIGKVDFTMCWILKQVFKNINCTLGNQWAYQQKNHRSEIIFTSAFGVITATKRAEFYFATFLQIFIQQSKAVWHPTKTHLSPTDMDSGNGTNPFTLLNARLSSPLPHVQRFLMKTCIHCMLKY